MPVDGNTIFFTSSFKEVAGNPNLVTCRFCTFSKDLKFPLTGRYFCIYTFDVEAGVNAQVKVIFNDFATKGIFCAHGAVVWSLWRRVTLFREAQGFIGGRIPQKIFLLK